MAPDDNSKVASKIAPKAARRSLERRSAQRLSSVATAVRLLKTFSEDEAEIGVTAMARRLGVAKSTVYRLATTLVSEGMLEQNHETERYRLGLALFGLGALVRQRMNVSTEGRPHLFELRAATNETVHLAILQAHEIMYVLNLESNQAIRMRADLGSRKPAFCTAEGLAMLAFQTEDFLAAVQKEGFQPRTPYTLLDPKRWRDMLCEVRRRGYAIEDEQSELGMRSIAAPIRDSSRRVVASVGLAGPVQRLSDDVIERFVPLIVGAAATISARLGYYPRSAIFGRD